MKLHLPKQLVCALMAAAMVAPAAYATSLDDAVLSIDSFTEANLSALEADGWVFTNITGSENGTYTSTSNRGVISGNDLTGNNGGGTNRHPWTAVVTVTLDSLRSARLVQGPTNDQLSNGMGLGYVGNGFGGSVTGTWEGQNPYGNMTLSVFRAVYDNGDGTVTMGVTFAGNNGTTVCIGEQTTGVGGLRWTDTTNKIALADAAGVTYNNLYWVANGMTADELKAAVASVATIDTSTYAWNGTGETAQWNFVTENWTKDAAPSAIANGSTKLTFGSDAALSKNIEVTETVGTYSMNVQDDYTFTVSDSKMLEVMSLTIANSKTMTVNGAAAVGSLSESGKLVVDDLYVTNASFLNTSEDHVQADTIHLSASSALANGTTTTYNGNLVVEEGVTFTTTTGKLVPSDISSLASLSLNGATLSSNSSIGTVKNLTVTEKGGRINYTDFPNFEGGVPTTTDSFAGKTTLNGDLTIHTTYKSSAEVAQLSGSGHLTLSSDNRTDGGNRLSINSLEGFTGSITLAPGATTNMVDLHITNNTAEASIDTIMMKNGSVLTLNGTKDVNAQHIYMTGGTLNVESGTWNVTQLMMSKEGSTAGTVTVGENATLHITGTVTNATEGGNGGSFELCNWNAANTVTVRGHLISDAGITMEGPGTPTVNIENGGILSMNAGITQATRQGSPTATINVKNGGTLELAGTTAIGNADNVTVNLQDGSTLEGIYDSNGSAYINKVMAMANDGTVTVKSAQDKTLTLNGTIGAGSTAKLSVEGAGITVLSAANTYSGGTDITEGTLVMGNASALGTGAVTIAAGAQLKLATTTANIATLNGVAGSTVTTEDDTTLNVGAGTFAGTISGPIALSKTGSGTLTLSAANAHSTTSIAEGTLVMGNASALGTGAVTIASGATLDVNGNTIANAVTTAGNIVNNGSELYSLSNGLQNVTLSGNAVIGGSKAISMVKNGGADTATLAMGGNTLTVSNDKGLYMNKTNVTGGGAIDVTKGSIVFYGSVDAAGTTLNLQNGAKLEINKDSAIGGLTGSGSIIIATDQTAGKQDSTLTINTVSDTTASSAATINGENHLTIKKTGAGEQIFTGALNDIKSIVVEEGDLTVKAASTVKQLGGSGTVKALADLTVTEAENGKVTLGGMEIAGNTTVTVNDHAGTLTLGSLTVTGSGSTINADLDLSGATVTLNGNSVELGCDLKFDGTAITLSDDDIAAISGAGLLLFSDVESLTLGTTTHNTDYIGLVDASGIILTLAGDATSALPDKVFVNFSATDKTVSLSVVPEPATATLSLLALAALASRRRRK